MQQFTPSDQCILNTEEHLLADALSSTSALLEKTLLQQNDTLSIHWNTMLLLQIIIPADLFIS